MPGLHSFGLPVHPPFMENQKLPHARHAAVQHMDGVKAAMKGLGRYLTYPITQSAATVRILTQYANLAKPGTLHGWTGTRRS